MIIRDPLYGAFELPPVARTLLQSPEFRRLSEIRLLNSISPSLATLGEIKRYSHTLGVVHLCAIWSSAHRSAFSAAELRAFEAATLLHDVGTPPFGHLFEYLLRDRSGWHHEAVITKLLRGHHAPENIAHQFFAGRTPEVYNLIHQCSVDLNLLTDILEGKHLLSRLIFGSLDFDNLDNVVRMAWALGLPSDSGVATRLASAMSAAEHSDLLLPVDSERDVREWLQLRGTVYEILLYDWPTVAAQAVLTRAIEIAIKLGALDSDSWSLTDAELLTVLRSCRESKDLVNNEYLGVLPTGILLVHLSVPKENLRVPPESDLIGCIEETASRAGVARPLGFVLRDKGMLQKELKFCGEDKQPWLAGRTSIGTFIYLFSRTRGPLDQRIPSKLLQQLAAVLGFREEEIIRVVAGSGAERTSAQGNLV